MTESSNSKQSNKPARITEMDARDLIGRLVINEHGAEFVVTKLSFDSDTASVVIWIAEFDEEGDVIEYSEAGVQSIEGWSIHQKIV